MGEPARPLPPPDARTRVVEALARFIEREVRAELAAISQSAIDTGTETPDGRAVYLHPDWPDVRFVVARRRPGEARPTLVTVLDRLRRKFPEARADWRRRRG